APALRAGAPKARAWAPFRAGSRVCPETPPPHPARICRLRCESDSADNAYIKNKRNDTAAMQIFWIGEGFRSVMVNVSAMNRRDRMSMGECRARQGRGLGQVALNLHISSSGGGA